MGVTDRSIAGRPQPRIGVVIPVFRQPLLVDEALQSVLDQTGATPPVVAAVNDGCPMPETETGLRAWAAAHDRVHVLRRWNGGLSAARNTGARYLLGCYPSIEALFFLDADNLLEPGALAIFERLLDDRPGADWFYPQFDMFGLSYNASNCGPYSLLLHTVDNMCEAGSLVRRRVFEAGVQYDESMRLGYEDWDFWLSAAREGFRGEPVDAPVFRYRKRPESMLSGSHRYDAELRGYLRRKHAWLYNPRTVLALEHAEAPRYRLLQEDGGAVAATDPLAPHPPMDADAFAREAWTWIATNGETGAGAIWIAATRAAWDALRDAGLLRFALWDLERRLDGVNVATLLLERGEDDGYAIDGAEGVETPHLRAGVVAMGAKLIEETLRDPSDLWLRQMGDLQPPQSFSHRRITLPADAPAGAGRGGATVALRETILDLRRHRFREGALRPATWRAPQAFPKARSAEVARRAAASGVLYPALPVADARRVCFLLTIAEFGGVETVTMNVAAALRAAGFRTALCLVGVNQIRLAGPVEAAFDEVLWFPDRSMVEWSGPVFEGTRLARQLDRRQEMDLIGLLGGFDCVIGCHAAAAAGALGSLRRAGVVTGLHEHVLEVSPYGREFGPPIIALAYEAAADFIATCSRGLADWLHGQGVPESKLVVVPNAPGYPMTTEEQAAVMRRRAADRGDRPLRALFVGRFDRQKGLDRLVEIVERLQDDGAPVEWRVVGKAVVDAADDAVRRLKRLVTVEPAVSTAEERTALYAWADVVVMPSRYEGLPLTVLEAQRCGAVPVVTQAGAVEEAVTDGVDGFVVSQEACVDKTAGVLREAAADRDRLAAIAGAAAGRTRGWREVARPLIDVVDAEIARKRSAGVQFKSPVIANPPREKAV